MKRISLIFALILFSVVSMSAQKPIKWRSSVKMTSKTEGVITIRAIIQQGWHLYGTNLPQGGPKATKFDFSSSKGIELVGQVTPSVNPKTVFDKSFGMNLNWWEQSLTFTQKFKVTDKSIAKIIGSVSYMGCNDETCLPPATQAIKLSVPAYKK